MAQMIGSHKLSQYYQDKQKGSSTRNVEISKPSNTLCEACRHGKQTKFQFKTKEHFASHPLELIHTDLCGPVRKEGLDGELYFMLMIDDYNRMIAVSFLKKKSEAFECFKC